MMMWRIDEQEDESENQAQILTSLAKNQRVLSALALTKMNSTQINTYDYEQLDLENYLEAQRANTQNNQHKTKIKKKILTVQQKQMEQQYKQSYGMGYKMLQGMGYNLGKGLGKNQQGRTNIIQAQFKNAFTNKDEDSRKRNNKSRDSDSECEEQQSETQQQQNVEQLFLYKSKDSNINNFISRLKSSYEIVQTKLSIAKKQVQSSDRESQLSQSFKLQKENQIMQIDKQLEGLQAIHKNIHKASKFPSLGLKYNLDLLIVKEAIEKLLKLQFNTTKPHKLQQDNLYVQNVKVILEQSILTLSQIFLQKQRSLLEQYNTNNISATIFRDFPQNSQNSNRAYKMHQQMTMRQKTQQDIKQISGEDIGKLNKYMKMMIEQGVIKNRVQTYLRQLTSIQQCQFWVLDLLQLLKKYDKVVNSVTDRNSGNSVTDRNSGKQYRQDGEILGTLKQKYIIQLCNKSLRNYKYTKNKQKLPHHYIFPWLSIVSLSEIDIAGFMQKLCMQHWKLDQQYLFKIISPWMQYVQQSDKDYFLNLYLAPRLLYQMQRFDISSAVSVQQKKNMLKQLLAYTQLLPSSLRSQIISNSIGLQLVQTYKQLEKGPNAENNKQQIDQWVLKWAKKIDGKYAVSTGIIKSVFQAQGIQNIPWY